MDKVTSMNFHYDEVSDVLYANVGTIEAGEMTEHEGAIATKHNIETGEPIGFLVIDYMRRVRGNILRPIPHFGDVVLPVFGVNIPKVKELVEAYEEQLKTFSDIILNFRISIDLPSAQFLRNNTEKIIGLKKQLNLNKE